MMPKSLSRTTKLVLLAVAGCFNTARAQTVTPFYSSEYSIRDLGNVPGILATTGALTFKSDDPNKIVVRFDDKFMAVTLQRNADKRIIGFSNPTVLSDAEGYISSLTFGPNGALFFNNGTSGAIGEVKPGDGGISRYIGGDTIAFNGEALGTITSVAFVPAGFAGAGRLKIGTGGSTTGTGNWYDTTVRPDGSGTYDIVNPVVAVGLPLQPEAAAYMPAGQAKFTNASVLMVDYAGSRVVSFEVNNNGDPVAATARDVVTGLIQALSIARDPVTGDVLMTAYSGSSFYLLGHLPASPPTVALTSPANNSAYRTKDTIQLIANASVAAGSNGEVAVEFFDGATSLGIIRETPFRNTAVITQAGIHRLTAVATANGLSTTSSVVSVTITDTPNVLPTVQLTGPLNGLTVTECFSVTLSATASDSDGAVTNVSFFANALLLGTVAQPPYTITVYGLPFATNAITAVATDDSGGRTISAVRTVFTQVLPSNTLKAGLLPGSRLQLCFRGALGSNYVFEASTNVSAPIVWQPFATNVAPSSTEGLITLIDSQPAVAPRKFYRTHSAP